MAIYPVFLAYAGCPHRCRYCRQPPGDLPDPAALARSLEAMLPLRGDGEVAFYGGTFTLLPEALQERYLAAVAALRRAGRVRGVRLSTRPDALEAETVERLRQHGVTTVEIGCQSFCPQVLAAVERGHGPEAAGLAVARLRRCGLRVGLQLMPGLPGGDRREAVASLHAALRLDPDFLRLYPAVVFQGTPLADDWREGRYHPWPLQEAVDCCAELLWRCRQAAVPVVRTGLQADPALTTAIVAGPWHPAFGQLVQSRLWLRALTAAAKQSGGREAGVAHADLSDALGHRRENLIALRQIFPSFTITARPERSRGFLALAGREFDLWQMAGYGAA